MSYLIRINIPLFCDHRCHRCESISLIVPATLSASPALMNTFDDMTHLLSITMLLDYNIVLWAIELVLNKCKISVQSVFIYRNNHFILFSMVGMKCKFYF